MSLLKFNKESERNDMWGLFPFPFSQRLEVRAQVAQAFLAKFQLSNEEMATLRGARDAPITEVISIILFTAVLNHVHHCHPKTGRMY